MSRYTDKETGEAAGTGAGGFFGEDRIPPILPINWQDWLTDPHVREMNETMQGVFFLIMLEQWQSGRIDYDPVVLARHIGAHDPRNVKKFLARWGHLFVCSECAGVVQHLCDTHATPVQYPCRYCAGLVLCACGTRAGLVQNVKLKNYSIDAKNGLRLGTTKPKLNGIEENGKEENANQLASQQASTPSILSTSTEEEPDGEDWSDGNSPEAFRWSLAIHLFRQLRTGFDMPREWQDDARPLMDRFTTHEEHEHILALTMWAYGRPEDNFWRDCTANMKAFVTHVLKGTLLRQFDEALTKPETWVRQYYISPPDDPKGRCPFPEALNAYIRLSDEMIETIKATYPDLANAPWDSA